METRDIVNAPQLKNKIIERSQKRQDDPEITQWLEKKFFEFIIKQFHPVMNINSIASWKTCQLPMPVPEWFLKKLEQPNSQMLFIDPLHEQILALEKPLLEFFNSRLNTPLKAKFMKMTYEQVLQAWHKDHELMKKRLEKGQWESSEHAVKQILQVKTGKFIEITATGQLLRQEMAFESRYMQHCLGQFENLKELKDGYGEYYVTQKEQGMLRYFSLRDFNNKPHVTISLEWDGEEWCIEQIKGKQNEVPVKKYADDVLDFLNFLKPKNNQNSDCTQMGVLYRPDILSQSDQASAERIDVSSQQSLYFYFYELTDDATIETIVMQNAHLMALCKKQSRVLQWMMIATGNEEHIQNPNHPLIDLVQKYNQTEFDLRKLDFDLVFEKKKEMHILWHLILLPFYLFFILLTVLSQIPVIGWLFKILLVIFAIPAIPFVKNNAQPRKSWALATGDLIYWRNKISYYELDSISTDEFKVQESKFKKHLDDLIGLEENTQIARLQKIEFAIKEYFNVGHLNIWYDTHSEENQPFRQMMVYAHIQKIVMMRLLTQFEYINEDEAWKYILSSAQIIQDCCDSWQQMGQYYAKGRELDLMIRHNDYENYDRSARYECDKYLESSSCNWKSIAWDLDLFPEFKKTYKKELDNIKTTTSSDSLAVGVSA